MENQEFVFVFFALLFILIRNMKFGGVKYVYKYDSGDSKLNIARTPKEDLQRISY